MTKASVLAGVAIGIAIGVTVSGLSSWQILSTPNEPQTRQIKVNDIVLYEVNKQEGENKTSGPVCLCDDKREVSTKSEGSKGGPLQIPLPRNITNEAAKKKREEELAKARAEEAAISVERAKAVQKKREEAAAKAKAEAAKKKEEEEEEAAAKEKAILPYGYNLGDLMNMPSYLLGGQFPRSGWGYSLTIGRDAAISFPDSIIGIYGKLENFEKCYTLLANNLTQNRRPCAIFPIIRTLKQAVNVWGMMNAKKSEEINARLGEDVLIVHVRSGDSGRIEKTYFSAIQQVSKLFKKTILISGVHKDERYRNNTESQKNVHSDVASLQKVIRNLEFFEGSPDAHIFMMQQASHLLVHKGGFSALGALLNEGGNVYHTEIFEKSFNISLFENLRRSRNTKNLLTNSTS